MSRDALETVFAYHEATKHYPDRFAPGPGHMDWATQPDPFRRFAGAPTIELPLTPASAEPGYDDLYVPKCIVPRRLTRETLGAFLQYALGLSAWKQYRGSQWALRMNPSSGNLHPTEGYVIVPVVDGVPEAGVYHYAPKNHLLERRRTLAKNEWFALAGGLPSASFLVALTSIHWRESWKYGERAFRYCQHDVGHAIAALSLSAAVLGWRVVPLADAGDRQLAGLLGLDRVGDFDEAEEEHPDWLMAVATEGIGGDGEADEPAPFLTEPALDTIRGGAWHGRANRLSYGHVDWPMIDEVTNACHKPEGAGSDGSWKSTDRRTRGPTGAEQATPQPTAQVDAERRDSLPPCTQEGVRGVLQERRDRVSARGIIAQRRSAVAMDGQTGISADAFYLMLDRTLPRYDRAPWRALGPPAFVHLGLFVHLVEGLEPGLYLLLRKPGREREFRQLVHDEFEWVRPPGCPEHLPLWRMISGDARRVAGQISCGQQIAAGGAFALGMLAEFDAPLRAHGRWLYRRLFWETGMIGQVLYLEAEAAGVSSTGIGCFFDDAMHELFGLDARAYQSLYHFTVGGPVVDERLTTLEPYAERTGG